MGCCVDKWVKIGAKTHFFTPFKPISAYSQNPTFYLSGPYRAMRAVMRCERRCVLNTKWRCDAKILAMRVLAAEILCDALPRCENTSDAMPRCRPLSFLPSLRGMEIVSQTKKRALRQSQPSTIIVSFWERGRLGLLGGLDRQEASIM